LPVTWAGRQTIQKKPIPSRDGMSFFYKQMLSEKFAFEYSRFLASLASAFSLTS
jgi:hypothetical protein